jgi:hypothetical protein
MKMLVSLMVKEMQIKTIIGQHLRTSRMAIIKKMKDECWPGYDVKGILVQLLVRI